MHNDQKQANTARTIRSVIEVMDEALMQEGWTREQLDAQRRTGDIIAELMAEGYSGEHLDAELQRRISQAECAAPDKNGAEPRTARKKSRQQTAREGNAVAIRPRRHASDMGSAGNEQEEQANGKSID